ncbi:lysylphosphatidylglycerol synthase transmembrane domain-containing protein [Methanocella conradii]|uniref:lysylphosphatidylglycerol synthase transmembrane domain-containing protein n=1 Tax=Methanocella conradii TaxID=1175444 RepID=UPI0024B38756|nr:lysylphosphatidylglycerol synthase transmembrane domain-containing protein [Methanocella conradii]MDI6896832.1 lysylphosphatidylglycerol synthase transmembrane domain-containing protein [Methanocella conradii]
MSSITKRESLNFIKKIIPILIGVAIIVGFIYKIGIQDIVKTITSVDLSLFCMSLLFLCCAMLLKCYRWYALLRPLGIENIRLTSYSYFIGQITNELLPTGSGELVRIAILKSKLSIGFMNLVPGIVLERFFDIMLLFVLSIVLATVLITPTIMIVLMMALICCILVFIRPGILQIIAGKIKQLNRVFSRKLLLTGIVSTKMTELSTSLRFYNSNKKMIIFNILLTIVAWIVFESLSQYILLLGFNIHISFLSMLGIVAISWIMGTASMLPGGLGAREVVYALALSSQGTTFETGLSIAMLYRAMVYILFALLAIISFYLYKSCVSYRDHMPNSL